MTRPKDDHYPTPPEVTRALLMNETFEGGIWEPCAGYGDMSNVLKEQYVVIATTLHEGRNGVAGGYDFFGFDKSIAPNIVTNPPYHCVNEFVIHALDLKPRKMALLLNINFLGSEKRRQLIFSKNPFARIVMLSNRVSFYPVGWEGARTSTTQNYAWFIWESGAPSAPIKFMNTTKLEENNG